MTKRRWPRGVAKYIRKEKARIRKTAQDPQEQERLIQILLDRYTVYRKS